MATPDRGMFNRPATASLTCRQLPEEPHLGFGSRYTRIKEICHHDDIARVRPKSYTRKPRRNRQTGISQLQC